MRFSVLGCYSPFAPYKGACNGYLLENNNIKIMIDIGNGSFANLQKFINYKELDALIITHFHGDHYSDFEMLRKAFSLANDSGERKNPLIVFAPGEDPNFAKIAAYTDLFALIPIEESLEKDQRFGDMVVRFFKTDHTIPCYGVKAKKGRKKISYTSDTAFSENVAQEVMNSDYLFAEASLLEKDKERTINGHMTAKEAGQLGEIARVKKLVLTHLNPEYNLNLLKREAEITFEGKVETAVMLKTYNV